MERGRSVLMLPTSCRITTRRRLAWRLMPLPMDGALLSVRTLELMVARDIYNPPMALLREFSRFAHELPLWNTPY